MKLQTHTVGSPEDFSLWSLTIIPVAFMFDVFGFVFTYQSLPFFSLIIIIIMIIKAIFGDYYIHDPQRQRTYNFENMPIQIY